MTATSTTTVTTPTMDDVVQVNGAPDGILRLFVPDALGEIGKGQLRTRATQIAGTIDVGRVPAGKPGTLKATGAKGRTFDFAPVVHRNTRTAESAPTTAPTVPDNGQAAQIAYLIGLGLTPEAAAAAVAQVPVAADPGRPAKGSKAPKPETEWQRTHLHKWDGVVCKTCRDFGKVRGPSAGAKAGHPFRQQRGADTSPTAVPCPSHVTATAGKRGKRSA